MQTSLRPVVATSSAAAAGYQYYQHAVPHQHEHLELMPESSPMRGPPVDESALSINQYRHYDNYHHHHHHQQLDLIHNHHQQQVNFHNQTIEPICYTSLDASHRQQHLVDEHQIVAYDNVESHHHYQLLEAPQRGAGQQQVVVEVEQPGGEMYQQHLLPEQPETQQQQQPQASYQTIYYEPTVIEQPLIEQQQLQAHQNHHQVTAFAQLVPLPPPSAPEAPEGCYHQFQYHQQLDHVPHIESCNLVLDAIGQLTQTGAEPQVQVTESAAQANYAQSVDSYLQPGSFNDNAANQETSEQLQYRALEQARVKNLSSTPSSGNYLQQQQESVETNSSLLIHPQPSTGMTHSAEHHHSLPHDHNHNHHRHHRRDESLSSSASSTSSSSAASTSEESSASSLTRDERKAREANIPLSYYEIVNLSIEHFNEQLAKYSLSEAQLTLIKDIRRRGKNKVAAQSCRKRKMEQIFELQHEVHNLANKRRNLGFECGQLIKEHASLVQEYDKVYAIIQDRMQQLPQVAMVAASSSSPPPQPTTTSSIT